MSNARSKESGMRKLWLGIIGLAAASTANAAVVTYTLSLHETATGAVTTAQQYVVYATVSQGDNGGLFAFGVDLKGQGEPGGPTGMTVTGRSPTGQWDTDPNDPNNDGGVYTKFGGFSTGRNASNTTGIISGVQDLAKSDPSGNTPGDLVRVFRSGQAAHKMDDFRPGPVPNASTGDPI